MTRILPKPILPNIRYQSIKYRLSDCEIIMYAGYSVFNQAICEQSNWISRYLLCYLRFISVPLGRQVCWQFDPNILQQISNHLNHDLIWQSKLHLQLITMNGLDFFSKKFSLDSRSAQRDANHWGGLYDYILICDPAT